MKHRVLDLEIEFPRILCHLQTDTHTHRHVDLRKDNYKNRQILLSTSKAHKSVENLNSKFFTNPI